MNIFSERTTLVTSQGRLLASVAGPLLSDDFGMFSVLVHPLFSDY